MGSPSAAFSVIRRCVHPAALLSSLGCIRRNMGSRARSRMGAANHPPKRRSIQRRRRWARCCGQRATMWSTKASGISVNMVMAANRLQLMWKRWALATGCQPRWPVMLKSKTLPVVVPTGIASPRTRPSTFWLRKIVRPSRRRPLPSSSG